MQKLPMCRICLIEDVHMHYLTNANLQETYEKLTGILFETKDVRPPQLCYMCYAKLRNCHQLRASCLRSEEIFTQMLENNEFKLTRIGDNKCLQIIKPPIIQLSINPDNTNDSDAVNKHDVTFAQTHNVQVKEEYIEDTEDNNMQENFSIEFILPRHITDSDDLRLKQGEMFECSILNIKTEDNSDPDSSKLIGHDVIGKNNIETNRDASSLNLNKIKITNKQKLVYMKEPSQTVISTANSVELKTEARRKNTEITEATNDNTAAHVRGGNPSGKCYKPVLKDSTYKCITCGKYFTKKSYLVKHKQLHIGEKTHKCSICEKSFAKKDHLLTHVRIHSGEKPYKCDVCEKFFNQKSNLMKHNRIHTGEKPYTCRQCGKSFNKKGNLSAHLRIHSSEKPYKCDICDRSFKQQSHLLRHHRIHLDEKPFSCNTCGKNFNFKCNLLTHVRIHSGEKPYKCDMCGKYFAHKRNVVAHIRLHITEKPYKCDICEKLFSHEISLANHMSSHTGAKPFHCNVCGESFTFMVGLSRHARTHSIVPIVQ